MTIAMLLPLSGFSQNWLKVGDGFDLPVSRLHVDSFTNTLYACGNMRFSGNVPTLYIAKWNGSFWDSIPGIKEHPTNRIWSYKNELIPGDNPLFNYNNGQWDTLATFPWGGVFGVTTYQDSLVVFGGFDSINGIPANGIAKRTGSTWAAFDTTYWYGAGMHCATEYKSSLYVGGVMSTLNPQISRIARWDGTQWLPLGNGLQGGFDAVFALEVYNNDLYVAGAFTDPVTNKRICIARWNGFEWLDIGTGTGNSGGVYDLQVFNDELYAAGSFNLMNGLSIEGVAKWNGQEWCGIGFKGDADCLAVYNNELYVGGNFITVNGDTVNHITKWSGGNFTDTCGALTSIENISNEKIFTFYPNPTNDKLHCSVTHVALNSTIQITTIEGKVILTGIPVTQPNFEIDVSALPAGIYFLQLSDERQRVVRKFVKQ